MRCSITIASLAAVAIWTLTSAAQAQVFDEEARSRDIQDHFNVGDHFGRDWDDGRFNRGDAIDRTLQRGADPLRANFGPTGNYGGYGGYNDGVQHYGSPNYMNHYFGTGYYGGEFFPGQWYQQNRRFITPYGGLYRNPSDRYFTR